MSVLSERQRNICDFKIGSKKTRRAGYFSGTATAYFWKLTPGGRSFQALLKSRRVELSSVLVTTSSPCYAISKNMRLLQLRILVYTTRGPRGPARFSTCAQLIYSVVPSRSMSYIMRS